MKKKLHKVWEGQIKNTPEKYIKSGIPRDCTHVAIYSNGSRIYHKGLNPESRQIQNLNQVMSRCWDSLPIEIQKEINRVSRTA